MDKRSIIALGALLIVIGGAFLFFGNIGDGSQLVIRAEFVGESMTPTIKDGDRIGVYAIDPDKIQRGDIISFVSPVGSDTRLVKRVVGIPGDTVYIESGDLHVHLDGNELYEPYMGRTVSDPDGEFAVGENEVFVSGDNLAPGASLDSKNDLGNVPFKNIIGIVR